jgi:hypothetical protein
MNSHSPALLAKELLDGSYSPSMLDNCTPGLPVDLNPKIIRYSRFFLFGNPKPDPRLPKSPEYLILPQLRLFNPDPDPDKAVIDKLINPLAKSLSKDLLTGGLPDAAGEVFPDPEDTSTSTERIRTLSAELRIPGFHPDISDAEVRSLYGGWLKNVVPGVLRDRLGDLIAPMERAGFDFEEELRKEIKDPKSIFDVLSGILKKVLIPSPYQPFKNPYPHFAVCAVFEQTWEHKGYTRGELINSISLAPGEQQTLEVHSWDKSTIKSEEELATESEMRVSENLTERDARTVARQVSSNFNITAMIPLEGGGSITPSARLSTGVNQTVNQTRDRTVQASNTIKNTRKLRIEVSRETGREQKQTRTIANTNRCRTLNCHYFEIMTNYLVTTKLVSVRLCLLLPNARFKITPAWVLCHQDVLVQALLDKLFLPGFDAAKTLETHARFLELKKKQIQEAGEVGSTLENELKTHVDAILNSFGSLNSAIKKVKSAARSSECKAAAFLGGSLGWAACVAAKSGITVLRRVLYMALIHTNEPAINALNKLRAEKDTAKPSEGLKSFFAVVLPRDFQYNSVTASIAKALDSIGIPGDLVDALLKWGLLSFVDFAADDAGLYNNVKAASMKLEEAWTGTAQTAAAREGYSTMEIASAQAVFEQLRCHIEDNWVHYMQAVWLRENVDQRFLRLQGYGKVADILENEVLGFLAHKAAYPIIDPNTVKPWVDFEAETRDLTYEPAEPQFITLPTQGTILEAVVGECEACEDFIVQSRLIDLRVQEAKAEQEEAEAKRREMRLNAQPPDLSDPKCCVDGNVSIAVNRTTDNPPAPA